MVLKRRKKSSQSLIDFKKLYIRELGPTLTKFKSERRRFHLYSLTMLLILLPNTFIILAHWLNFGETKHFFYDPIIAFYNQKNLPKSFHNPVYFIQLFLLALSSYKVLSLKHGFKKRFKKKIIEKIVKCASKDFTYTPSAFIDREIYSSSRIFKEAVNSYTGDDLIEGTVDGIDFSMSELHTSYSSNEDGVMLYLLNPYLHAISSKSHQYIFDGLFFNCNLKKRLRFETVIVPDVAEGIFGKLVGQTFQSLTGGKKRLVKLENPTFEKKFAVYSENQIEARTILTPKIMEFMTALHNHVQNRPMFFSFIGDNMYIAVKYKKLSFFSSSRNTLFEPPRLIFGNPYKKIKKNYNLIKLPLSIAKKMNENSKIWAQ